MVKQLIILFDDMITKIKLKQNTVCDIRGSTLQKKKKIFCLGYRRELIEFLAESCKTRCEILSL